MSEQVGQEPAEVPLAGGVSVEQPAEPETEAEFSLDDVKKTYFAPSKLEEGNVFLQRVLNAGITPIFNFKPDEDFPQESHGMLVAPISKRVDQKNVTQGIVVAAIPVLEAIIQHGEKGEAFVRDAILDTCFAKVANAVRPRDDGTSASHVPFSIEDFIESKRGSDALKAFAKLAPKFVKALKQMGLKLMTSQVLKHVLESSDNASQQFPKMKQEAWEHLLDKMIATAKLEQLDPTLFQNWRNNRNETTGMSEMDLDLSDIEIVD